MRLFPRAARPRLLAALTACVLAVGALTLPASLPLGPPPAGAAEKDLRQQQKRAKQDLRRAQHDFHQSSAGLRRAQAALDRARAELNDARRDLRAATDRLDAAERRDRRMRERLQRAEERLETAQQQLADGRAALEEQRLTVTDSVTDYYEQGDPGLLAFASLLNARSTADLTLREEAHDVIVGKQTAVYADLHAAEVQLALRESQVADARDEVEAERAAAAAHLASMEVLHRETKAARDHVVRLVEKRRTAQAKAVKMRQRDRRALQQAKRQEERIRQRILAAARTSKRGYTGSTNGLFIRPVAGGVTSSFGYRRHPIYHYWGMHDGTDFGAGCGTPMRAIAGGRVIAKHWSSVYGNRLYLSLGQINGKSFTAVYNHATGYRVGVGDRVRQGEVVGYVGSTGWSTGCHLHFTILVNGKAQNPMTWLP